MLNVLDFFRSKKYLHNEDIYIEVKVGKCVAMNIKVIDANIAIDYNQPFYYIFVFKSRMTQVHPWKHTKSLIIKFERQ